ncbi:MAG: hypothetical protein H6635_14030 [Anaerolineales bacterium]|nr:hypothetical protein [Anaerolineales bacterium]MCB9146482.1 hypothetical protein [Anaerolineales bacterium]
MDDGSSPNVCASLVKHYGYSTPSGLVSLFAYFYNLVIPSGLIISIFGYVFDNPEGVNLL